MKKYLVLIGLSLLLATVFLSGCATNQEDVASLESKLQEVNTRVSELELRISSLEGELLVKTAKDAGQDAELSYQDLRLDTLIYQLKAAGIELKGLAGE